MTQHSAASVVRWRQCDIRIGIFFRLLHIYYEFSYQQGVPGGPAGLDHIRTSASSAVAGSNRSLGLPSGQGATAPLESNSGKMLPVDVLCKNCRKEANFMCSACKSVHYCSIDCQVRERT